MIFHKSDAIRSLIGGFAPDEAEWKTLPTDSEIDAEIIRLSAEYDANQILLAAEYEAQTYARNRKAEYPDLGEQFDMQYHDQIDGTTTWKDAIAKVKSDNPKE